MNWTALLLCAFLASGLSAQSTADLDASGGFRDYKIGTEVSRYLDKVTPVSEETKDGSKTYSGDKPIMVLGIPGELELIARDGRVVNIAVEFENISLLDFDHLAHGLRSLYGSTPDESSNPSRPLYLRGYDKIFLWNGSSIGLQLAYDTEPRYCIMSFWGIKEHRERLKEEF